MATNNADYTRGVEENRKDQKRKADQQLAERRKAEAYVKHCAASYKTGVLIYYCKDCASEQNGNNGWGLQQLPGAHVSCTARACDEKTCSASILSTTVPYTVRPYTARPYNPMPIFIDSDEEATDTEDVVKQPAKRIKKTQERPRENYGGRGGRGYKRGGRGGRGGRGQNKK